MKNMYTAYADVCIEGLQQWYNWDTGLWDSAGWWNGANALEAVIDYAAFTRTDHYDNVIANTFEKNRHVNPLNNRGNFLRYHYDDQLWFTLTWIKAYDLTRRKDYLDMAVAIFHDVIDGDAWDNVCGGGIWWNRTHEYKNAITNELFFTAATRLYTRTGDEQYLSWANREWEWLLKSGLINSQHLIYDRLDANCNIGDEATWTYNQGVILGGLVEMYMTTNDRGYLSQAQSIAHAATTTLVADGILTEPSTVADDDADAAQFKGIFIRNLAYFVHILVHAYGSLSSVPAPYKQFITKNADTLWERNRINYNKFGLNWAARTRVTNAATQTSALDAFNAATAVYRL